MTDYGRNFGFDTDMEMDFTEHSQKRGESINYATSFASRMEENFAVY